MLQFETQFKVNELCLQCFFTLIYTENKKKLHLTVAGAKRNSFEPVSLRGAVHKWCSKNFDNHNLNLLSSFSFHLNLCFNVTYFMARPLHFGRNASLLNWFKKFLFVIVIVNFNPHMQLIQKCCFSTFLLDNYNADSAKGATAKKNINNFRTCKTKQREK